MQTPNSHLFPEIEPFNKNWLNVGQLHQIYFEECGNPEGVPVIFLHGGPGSGCNPTQRRFFDPAHYRIVLLDQRGCGHSKPLGETRENTTDDLVADIESLRSHLGISKWHVFGGSWGSTLGLAYALSYPQHIISLTLRGIFLSRPTELDWFLNEVKAFYPEPWKILCDFLPEDQRKNPILTYEKLVFSEDASISIPAAIAWNTFESSIMSLLPREPNSSPTEGEVELARARVQIHYIQHHCFVDGSTMLVEAGEKLSNIPTIIVQGRYDMVCPPITAWELAEAMPHAKLIMVPDAGHSAMEAGISKALIDATNQFRSHSADGRNPT